MSLLDALLLISLGGFVLAGFWFGLIHMIGSMIGLIGGAIIAGRMYEAGATIVSPFVGDNMNAARILAFVLLFVLVNRVIGILAWSADKVFRFFAVIPLMKTTNRILGAVLGLLEGTLVLGLSVYFSARLPLGQAATGALKTSELAATLNGVGTVLAPLLPEAIRMLQSIL